MRLLSGSSEKAGSKRALLMLAAGGAATAVLWTMSGAPVVDAVEVANQPPVPGNGTQQAEQPGFLPRTVASVTNNLFGGHSWYVAPPAPPPAVQGPPPAPTAPPLPFTILGSFASSGAKPVYFLVKGDRVYDARVGDVIDGTYSIDGVSNGRLNLTYLPLKIGQSLPLENSP